MASTFDPELLHKVGEFLADEAKVKSSVILLAPTCNIQRNPLGGRAFESFSEDPHLSGMFLIGIHPFHIAHISSFRNDGRCICCWTAVKGRRCDH